MTPTTRISSRLRRILHPSVHSLIRTTINSLPLNQIRPLSLLLLLLFGIVIFLDINPIRPSLNSIQQCIDVVINTIFLTPNSNSLFCSYKHKMIKLNIANHNELTQSSYNNTSWEWAQTSCVPMRTNVSLRGWRDSTEGETERENDTFIWVRWEMVV